jgi:hypothetical protein
VPWVDLVLKRFLSAFLWTMEEIFKNLMVEWQHTPFPSFIHRSNEEYLHQSYANIYAII